VAPERSRLVRTFASFSNYNYRLFWFGQLISQVGTWMQSIAQAWLVLSLTHSAVALGTVAALQFAPLMVLTLFAGVMVDRVPKHKMLIVTQSAALVQASALAFLTLSGQIQLWQLYILAACLGLINAFDNPTRQSFVMELVGRDNVVNAVGLNSAQINSSRLLGPAVGGLIIAAWGVGVCFLINAVSFIAVLIGLLLMRSDQFHAVVRRAEDVGHIFAQLGEGMRFVFKTPDLLVITIILTGVGAFGYNFNTVIPLLADDLQAGPDGFGLLMTAIGIGSLVAALTVATRGRPSRRAMVIASTIFGCVYLSIAFAPTFPLVFVLVALQAGFGLTFAMSTNTTLQLRAPDHLRGRVMGLYTLLMVGTNPIGSLATGFLAGRLGIRQAIIIEASIVLAGIAVAMTVRARMKATGRSPDAGVPAGMAAVAG